jgi:hypothetical protein
LREGAQKQGGKKHHRGGANLSKRCGADFFRGAIGTVASWSPLYLETTSITRKGFTKQAYVKESHIKTDGEYAEKRWE